MGIFKFKRNKAEEEAAAATASAAKEEKREEEREYAEPKPAAKKKGIISTIGDAVGVAKGLKSSVDEIYGTWIKPIMDNRAQIKRRWNGLVTAVSVIFFLVYVPILLFNRIYKGLSLGWDIALYVCIGVYIAMLVTLITVTVASDNSTSTEAAKRRKKAAKIILFIVRLASLAMAITAICISGNGKSNALDTIALVFATVSLVFSALALVFGGAVGFFKWLISPAKMRYKFSFVAFEWMQSVDEGKREQSRAVKKSYSKNRERIAACLDSYLLPAFGKAYIDTVDADKLVYVLGNLPDEDRNLTGWVIKDLFDYALGCGYVKENPCDGLELECDVVQEKPPKPEGEGAFNKLTSIFRRRTGKNNDGESE